MGGGHGAEISPHGSHSQAGVAAVFRGLPDALGGVFAPRWTTGGGKGRLFFSVYPCF